MNKTHDADRIRFAGWARRHIYREKNELSRRHHVRSKDVQVVAVGFETWPKPEDQTASAFAMIRLTAMRVEFFIPALDIRAALLLSPKSSMGIAGQTILA